MEGYGVENMSNPNTEPTTEMRLEHAAEIAQPAAPPAPFRESFKCEKCGTAFDNEGAAVVHIQTCKGTEVILEDDAAS